MILKITYQPVLEEEALLDEEFLDGNFSSFFDRGIIHWSLSHLDSIPQQLQEEKASILRGLENYTHLLENQAMSEDPKECRFEIMKELEEVRLFRKQWETEEDVLSLFQWIEISFQELDDFPMILNSLRFSYAHPKVVSFHAFESIEVLDMLLQTEDAMIPEGVLFLHRYSLTEKEANGKLTACSKKEMVYALQKLKSMADQIYQYSLSPFERIMLAYDFLRDRKYQDVKDVSDPEQYYLSRDFVQVLKNEEYAVCLGYASLAQVLFEFLNVDSVLVFLRHRSKQKIGHVRNLVLVDDPIYRFHFVSFLDVTFGRRKEDFSYLNSLRGQNFFSKNIPEEVSAYSCFTFADYHKEEKRLEGVKDLIGDETSHAIRNSIHLIYTLLDERDQIPYLNDSSFASFQLRNQPKTYLKLYYETIRRLNDHIPREDFIRCLYRVRRVEHSINPEKYPLSLNTLQTIVSSIYPNQEKDIPDGLLFLYSLFGKKKEKSIREVVNHLDVVSVIPGNYKLEKDEKRMHFLYEIKHLSQTVSDYPQEMKVGEIIKQKRLGEKYGF